MKEEKKSFEEKMKHLEEIAKEIENSDLPLEKMLDEYAEAKALIADLEKAIEDAKAKITDKK
jgi:exodeoxyribonuclease VII small subunit